MARNPQRAIMLMGIQGIGKSTWCKNQFAGDEYHLCSKDDLRFLVYPKDKTWEETNPYERIILGMHQLMVGVALDIGKIPIIDDVHANKRHRMGTLDFLKYHNRVESVELHVFEMNLGLALSRNAQREGKRRVPDEAIGRTYNTMMRGLMQPRTKEDLILALMEEGFDKVVLTYETDELNT